MKIQIVNSHPFDRIRFLAEQEEPGAPWSTLLTKEGAYSPLLSFQELEAWQALAAWIRSRDTDLAPLTSWLEFLFKFRNMAGIEQFKCHSDEQVADIVTYGPNWLENLMAVLPPLQPGRRFRIFELKNREYVHVERAGDCDLDTALVLTWENARRQLARYCHPHRIATGSRPEWPTSELITIGFQPWSSVTGQPDGPYKPYYQLRRLP